MQLLSSEKKLFCRRNKRRRSKCLRISRWTWEMIVSIRDGLRRTGRNRRSRRSNTDNEWRSRWSCSERRPLRPSRTSLRRITWTPRNWKWKVSFVRTNSWLRRLRTWKWRRSWLERFKTREELLLRKWTRSKLRNERWEMRWTMKSPVLSNVRKKKTLLSSPGRRSSSGRSENWRRFLLYERLGTIQQRPLATVSSTRCHSLSSGRDSSTRKWRERLRSRRSERRLFRTLRTRKKIWNRKRNVLKTLGTS